MKINKLKIILPIIALAIAGGIAKYLVETKPEAKKRPPKDNSVVVETIPLESGSYQIKVKASGVVKARTQSNLVAEISGRINTINEGFQEGAFFLKDDVLVSIDPANVKQAKLIAEGDLQSSKANLSQLSAEKKATEKNLQLAERNLQLGRQELQRVKGIRAKKLVAQSAVDIEEQKVLRLEQEVANLVSQMNVLESRRRANLAQVAASQAKLDRESLNVNRSQVKAPFKGRVLSKQVDVGQYVAPGNVLGTIYATDYVEVVLPLSLNQFERLNIPSGLGSQNIPEAAYPDVTFTAVNATQNSSWSGKVVRSSAALDANTRQISVIARIDNPFEMNTQDQRPIRIGQYVKANITGQVLDNVFVIPSVALRFGKEILLMEEGQVKVQPVDVLWNDTQQVVIRAQPDWLGKNLITTPLTSAVDGLKVQTVEQAKAKKKKKPKKENTEAKAETPS